MTPEELLKPRYKVIADYPGSKHNIGTILYLHGKDGGWGSGFYYNEFEKEKFPERILLPGSVEKYPSIFKKLEWWEGRLINDMPEYVKYNGDYNNRRFVKNYEIKFFVAKVHGWQKDGYFESLEMLDWHESNKHANHFIPATEQEYQSFKNSNP